MANEYALGIVASRPAWRVYCQANTSFSLGVRSPDDVVMVPHRHGDQTQLWVKDETHSQTVMDEKGYPCFTLINKATGQALQHSFGATHPARLKHWNPDEMDYSLLWTMSEDFGDNFRTIRMVNDITLNLDALHGDQGIHDGQTLVLWEFNRGGNQLWRIEPC